MRPFLVHHRKFLLHYEQKFLFEISEDKNYLLSTSGFLCLVFVEAITIVPEMITPNKVYQNKEETFNP